jgi:hypothetical protein
MGAEGLSAAEFSRLIRDLSEDDGYFSSDNFISNETSYLHVVGKMAELGVTGGAYLGVGPEQNFTYIAKVRPQIAFIVDIRRQAMIQHLMYKAVFHVSRNRAEFLSNLFSRPLAGARAPNQEDSPGRLIEYFSTAPAPVETFNANLARLRQVIEAEFQFPLSEEDQERLNHVYSAFHEAGLEINFRAGRPGWWGGYSRYPRLRDLLLQPGLDGKLGSFLAADEDYRFVRSLHRRNRIIPIVGDFAGPKALASVGDYLSKNGYTVRAFYTSNVEQFLFRYGTFGAFVANVAKLPIDDNSVFVRAVPWRGDRHPAHVAGHRSTTLLQKIRVFLEDYEEGAYPSYWSLVTTHYVAGQ